MSRELPRLLCPLVELGDVTADATATAWRDVPRVELRGILDGAAPAQGTTVRTAWTPLEWRILFECADRDPWATMTERDAQLFQEETVEVFLDSAGDLETYYEIEINPLGTILDIFFRRSRSGYKGDWAWNCSGLRSAARLTPNGWAAELGIPFSEVASQPPQPGTIWRVNFCRIDRPSRDGSLPRELTAWSPPLRETFHTPERFGFIEFVSACSTSS